MGDNNRSQPPKSCPLLLPRELILMLPSIGAPLDQGWSSHAPRWRKEQEWELLELWQQEQTYVMGLIPLLLFTVRLTRATHQYGRRAGEEQNQLGMCPWLSTGEHVPGCPDHGRGLILCLV